jgi:dolichol-phosphate mannosyltransferase
MRADIEAPEAPKAPGPASLAIIIPMYNEEQNAERCVRTVCAVLSERVSGAKLYAVNDGSGDATAQILSRLAQEELPFVFVDQPKNGGYGAALLAGARRAHADGFEFGLFMDSDLTNDPALIPQFADKLAEGKYDLIKASRYIPGGGMRGVPYWRQAYTIVGNRVASVLFGLGIRDCTNGFRAVRLRMIADAHFEQNGFPMILEELFLLKQQHARVTEIPYVLTSRADDEGVSKFSYSGRVLTAYLKYAVKAALVGRRAA